MKRVNIRFDSAMVKQLETRMTEKKCISLAQSARELIEIGFQTEEAHLHQSTNHKLSPELSSMMTLMKNHLKWTLETLLMTRHLIEQSYQHSDKNTEQALAIFKEQAMAHIQKIFSALGEMPK